MRGGGEGEAGAAAALTSGSGESGISSGLLGRGVRLL